RQIFHEIPGVYCRIHPPSTMRLTPLTPLLLKRNFTASTTSSVVASLPPGVRARTLASASGLSLHAGVSPIIPGWIALNRIGASSTAIVLIMLLTPPFTIVTVVEPG